jgi:hypothetical protein
MTDTKPPTIFGRDMSRAGSWWILRVNDTWIEVGPGHDSGWSWVAFGRRGQASGKGAAIAAIESRIRSLILSLAPLLDPDAKREVVRALDLPPEPTKPNHHETCECTRCHR